MRHDQRLEATALIIHGANRTLYSRKTHGTSDLFPQCRAMKTPEGLAAVPPQDPGSAIRPIPILADPSGVSSASQSTTEKPHRAINSGRSSSIDESIPGPGA